MNPGRAVRFGVGLCLAALACAAPQAALADVIELAADGSVSLKAADRNTATRVQAAPEVVDGLVVPANAITLVSASAAPRVFSATVDKVAEAHGISPALLDALVWQESRWHVDARSPAGAIGLAQLMPGTARDLGVDPNDPNTNLLGGARYLRQQLDRFDGDIERALAAYNAGPARVLRAAGIPRIAETQAYVRAIVDRLASSPDAQGASR
jgi:soluble lytic murein transglycosylase-like protein